VLAEKGAGKIAGYWVGFVLVFGLLGNEAAGVVVVGQDDALLDGIKADTELAAGLSGEAATAQGLHLTRKFDGRGL
jgi:hypothetical protein